MAAAVVWVRGVGPWCGSVVWVRGVGPWCGSVVKEVMLAGIRHMLPEITVILVSRLRHECCSSLQRLFVNAFVYRHV